MVSDAERRKSDRRKADMPYSGEDRRRGERRSGTDRRAQERKPGEPEAKPDV